MKLTITAIAAGSHGFRGWFNEEPDPEVPDSGEPYQVVGVYEHESDSTCRIGYTMGSLSDAVNIEIALGAYKLGYRFLKFHVKKGTKVSRWAKSAGTDLHFDYYQIDLDEAIKILETQQ